MNAIDKLIEIAENELGYLEKRSLNDLDSKTGNAGSGNYTKYWRDIKPEYQGQPWCACFVTWCFLKAFGKDNAKKLLKHYPYVYCPTMAELFTLNANPKVGDIVIFKRSGEFVHTGIVISVNGDYFKTIEGNTSSGSSIVANGGGVFEKGYYNSNLPGTKFISPKYEIIESEGLTMTQFEELKDMISELKSEINKKADKPFIYNYIDDNMPSWAKPTILKLTDKGILKGGDSGLNLTEDLMRMLVINDSAGLYD